MRLRHPPHQPANWCMGFCHYGRGPIGSFPPTAPPEFVYRAYSAVTHGQIYGLMNFAAPGVSSDGSGLRHWYLPPEVLDSTVQVTIGAFREVYGRINKVMGWGKLEGDLWEIRLWKIYGR